MRRAVFTGAIGIAALAAAVAAAEPDFSADRIRAHVTFLADDLLEGREAGTRGHEIAARYVAGQFALAGVRPGGVQGGYFRNVDLLESAQTGPAPVFAVVANGTTHTLAHPDKVLVRGTLAGGAVDLSAPLVFAGYGMKDTALGYDDYAGLDVRGRIAVVLFGSPKGIDSEIGAYLQSEQRRFAAEHGAVAVIFVLTRTTAAAFPWRQLQASVGAPQTTWVRSDGAPFDPSYGLRASAVIEPSVASTLFEGAPTALDAILDQAERDGGRPRGFALETTARIAVTTSVRRFSSPEVVGVIDGSDPALKDEFVLLMGHVDHIGVNKDGAGDRINNGALDNAAGTAMLIEVARALASADSKPRRSVMVVAHTAEEKGLLGAQSFAHSLEIPLDRIAAGIDLDMPMLLYDFTDVVAYGVTHSSLEQVFQKVTTDMGLKLSPDPMPEQAVFVRSDHYALVKRGVPAVMLATGMANGGDKAWATFLGKHYHQPSDDLSLPIVWSAGAKFAELNYRVVRALADADTRPQWYAGDYFGNLFAPGAAKAARSAR